MSAVRMCEAVLVGVVLSTAISCSRPANIDTVGEAIEQSGSNLQSDQSVETDLEALYEVDGAWTLMIVPPTGVDLDALTETKISEAALARVRTAAEGWRGGQYLVQVSDHAILSRMLAGNAVRIDRQFVVPGRGPVWVIATLKKVKSQGPPVLVSLSTKSR